MRCAGAWSRAWPAARAPPESGTGATATTEHSPLAQVQQWSAIEAGRALFESLVVFENYPVDPSLSDLALQLRVKSLGVRERTNYPLNVLAMSGPQLCHRIIYERGRFDDASILRLEGHLTRILEGFPKAAGARLGSLSLLGEGERRQLLSEWNATDSEHPSERTVLDLFSERAAATPGALAGESGGESLSYGELDRRSNRLARHLRGLGVGPEVLVGVCLGRSPQLLVGLLGILKDRWRLFSHVEQSWEQAETLPADLEKRTADEWLSAIGQSAEARERIWAPLAQWLTGNALARLSAATFVHLLSTVFLRDASDARFTYHSGTIDQRLLMPLKNMLHRNHAQVIPLAQPPHIRFGQDGIQDIRLPDGTTLQARWYFSALSYRYLLRLLPERFLTRYAYFAHLTELQSLGEIVVQLTIHTTNQPPRLLLFDPPACRPP